MPSTYIAGTLQIDHERGVIYFHSDTDSMQGGYCPTPLRICGLGDIKYPLDDRQIDLTIRPLAVQGHQLYEIKVVK